jgi:hypothetical protein
MFKSAEQCMHIRFCAKLEKMETETYGMIKNIFREEAMGLMPHAIS